MGKSKKIVILLVLLILVVVAGLFIVSSSGDKNNNTDNAAGSYADGCKGNERVQMKNSPMDEKDIDYILPAGDVAGAHVTPIDHLYFYPVDFENRDAHPVYAMADGDIIDISKREVHVDSGENRPAEYRIVIQHSCETVSYFDLLTSLDDSLGDKMGSVRIPVKAGQEIGRVGAQTLDTAVYNYDMELEGFITPSKYEGEPWKIHTDDFFTYFDGAVKEMLLNKNLRKVEPYGGKIDYDQKGKLIGNWFENDGMYSDRNIQASKDGKTGYWSGHLSIHYSAFDGESIVVSLGRLPNGSPDAFWVKGNSPDPASIDKSSGIVKYELIQRPRITPEGKLSSTSDRVLGTVLFQVGDNETLKAEYFEGKTADQVDAFTNKAANYAR